MSNMHTGMETRWLVSNIFRDTIGMQNGENSNHYLVQLVQLSNQTCALEPG